MKFDKNNKVIPESLTLEEAREFDAWLGEEIWRHERCVMEACDQKLTKPIIAPILESASVRHQKAIEGIIKLRIKLRELFEL